MISPERLELTEIFRIGDDARGNTQQFGQIHDLAVNSVGQLLVGDGNAKVVYVFSEQGALVRAFGQQGEGPGEFRSILDVHVGPSDSVFVWDSSRERLSVFEPERHHFAYSIDVSDDEGTRYGIGLVATAQNQFLMRFSTYYMLGIEAEGPSFDTIQFVDRQGKIVGEPVLYLPVTRHLMTASATGISVIILPFSRDSFIRSGPEGLLYSGWNDSISVAIHTIKGNLEGRIRYSHQPIPVTQEEIDDHMKDMSVSDRKVFREADLPETKPAYSTFVVDDQGRIWVKHTRTEETTFVSWTVVNSESEAVYEVVLPARVNLRVVKENRAYGRAREEGGAPYVIVYKLGE